MSKNLNPKISIFENPYIPMSKNLNTLISKNPNPNIPIYGKWCCPIKLPHILLNLVDYPDHNMLLFVYSDDDDDDDEVVVWVHI